MCTRGRPAGVGVQHTCIGVTFGGRCSATCAAGYTNELAFTGYTYTCNGTGSFEGTAPSSGWRIRAQNVCMSILIFAEGQSMTIKISESELKI